MATIASQLASLQAQQTPCRRPPAPRRAVALRELAVAKPYGFLQAKLTVGAVNDPLEQEADAAADRVMRMADPLVALSSGSTLSRECAACEEEWKEEHPLRREPAGGGMDGSVAPPIVHEVLNSPGRPLDRATHDFMASRFGADFGNVRIHTDAQAAQSAAMVTARAYTVGHEVVFGAGQYDPAREDGRRLLAHELSHVVQQGGADNIVRRAPIRIFPAGQAGPLAPDERQAAASCDVQCSGASIGTLHAMPLFLHTSRGAPLVLNVGADGIGEELHFVRNATAIAPASDCAACTKYQMIQIINSNEPSDVRGKQDFVDNDSQATPFYDDWGLHGYGAHNIPGNYVDGGEQIDTTTSIYDRPYRDNAMLASLKSRNIPFGFTTVTIPGQDFWWNAETCVTCVKPGKHKVLGNCATYGFRRNWDAASNSHGPAVGVGPACNGGPSAAFVKTLKNDSSTSTYQFET